MNASAALQMLLLSAVWGGSFILIKLAGETMPPAWVAVGRLGFGAALLWTVLLATGRRLPPRGRWGAVALAGFFNNAIPFSFFAWGELTVPSNLAAILNATTPLWSVLIAVSAAQARPGAPALAGVGIGFLGVTLAVSGGLAGGWGSPLGVGLIAVASLSYAIGAAVGKSRLAGLDPVGLATGQLTVALLMLLPVAALSLPATMPSAGSLAALAVLGFVGSGLAYLIFYGLLARVSPTQVVAVTYLLPIWGLFWGALAGEAVGWTALVGVVVILAGMGVLNFWPPAAARPASRAA